MELLFRDSPSLEATAISNLHAIYQDAIEDAEEEMGIAADLPTQCPWRPDQILDRNFLPE